MIKTRFAPSPTGFLHIGSLRTALYTHLFARHNDGVFILRVEDTDRNRLVEGAVEHLAHTLHWAGIQIDEGVMLDESGNITQRGDHGPYVQSERLDKYQEAIQVLLKKGAAYYAFDTKKELDNMRKRQEMNKQATIYDRNAMKNQLTIGKEETKKLVEAGAEYVIRLKVPQEGNTSFTDLVRGEVTFENNLIDDQVLMKADGYPTYHLANVVDDHDMEITHVIRGEEWVSSTPKHILLFDAFGWDAPQYAHLALLINEQKAKLSKRHGDVAIEDFKEKGYLVEAIINFVSFLGWNPGDEREIFTLQDLEKEFSLEKVSKSPAVFNREKLAWYNKQYIAKMDARELAERSKPFFVNKGLEERVTGDVERLTQIVSLEQGRAATLVELVDNIEFIFAEKLVHDTDLFIWKKSTQKDAKEKLQLLSKFWNSIEGEWSKDTLEEQTIAWIKEREFGVGDVLWPTRVALSGQKNSPGPFEIAAVLGKEKTFERIKTAVEKLST